MLDSNDGITAEQIAEHLRLRLPVVRDTMRKIAESGGVQDSECSTADRPVS